MKSNTKETTQKTIYSIKNFFQNPIGGLGALIPIVMYIITITVTIIGYIKFIMAGEYTKQIAIIKESGFTEGFTVGTANVLVSGIAPWIIAVLAFVQFIVTLIAFFRSAGKKKCIFMIIDVVFLMALLFALVFDFWRINMLFGVRIEAGGFIMGGLIAFGVFCWVLTAKTEGRAMFLGFVKGLIFHFIIMPLLILLLENIIPLVMAIVSMAILGLVFWFILGGLGGDTGGTANVSTDNSKGRTEKKESGKSMYISDYRRTGGINLYKRRGTFGDYIELDNHIVTKSICSIAEIQGGKMHLYDKATGREIKLEEIPWKN